MFCSFFFPSVWVRRRSEFFSFPTLVRSNPKGCTKKNWIKYLLFAGLLHYWYQKEGIICLMRPFFLSTDRQYLFMLIYVLPRPNNNIFIFPSYDTYIGWSYCGCRSCGPLYSRNFEYTVYP
jgi:hypothetical protein